MEAWVSPNRASGSGIFPDASWRAAHLEVCRLPVWPVHVAVRLRDLPALVVASEVGQDGEDPAVGVVGLGEAELGEDVADVLSDGRFGGDEVAGDGGGGV